MELIEQTSALRVDVPMFATIDVWPHPLSSEGRMWVACYPGTSLAEAIDDSVLRGQVAVASVNGRMVPMSEWTKVRVFADDVVQVRAIAQGGIARALGALGVVVGALLVGGILGPVLGLGALGTSILTAGLGVAGMLLYNVIFPPRLPELEGTSQPAPQYTLSGGSNRVRRHDPMLLVMGQHRVFPDIASQPYSEFDGDNEQYLNQIFDYGLGDILIGQERIGETLLSEFDEVERQAQVSRITLVHENVDTIEGGEFSEDTVTITRTTADKTTRVAWDLVSQAYDVSDKGKLRGRYIDYALRYRVAGTSAWVSAGVERIDTPGGSKGRNPVRKTVRSRMLSPNSYDVQAEIIRVGTADGNEMGFPAIDEDDTRTTRKAAVQFKAYQDAKANYAGRNPVALRIRATGQLSGSLDRVNAHVSQRIPSWDGSTWVPNQDTSNPGDILLWWYRGAHVSWMSKGNSNAGHDPRRDYDQTYWVKMVGAAPETKSKWATGTTYSLGDVVYGGIAFGYGLPDTLIDIPKVREFAEHCTDQGLEFNIVLEDGRDEDQVAALIAQAGWGRVSLDGGKYSVIWEEANRPVTAVVTPANIVAGSLSITYDIENLADEIVCTFVDRDSGYEENEVRRPVPNRTVTGENPVQIRLEGITSGLAAAKECNRAAAANFFHLRAVQWEMTEEGFAGIGVGDVVGMANGLLGKSVGGRLFAISSDRQTLTPTFDAQYEQGTAWVTVPGTLRTVHSSAFTRMGSDVVLADAMPDVAERVVDTPYDYRIQLFPSGTVNEKVRVTQIESTGGGRYRFTARDEHEGYYDARTSDLAHELIDPRVPAFMEPLAGFAATIGDGGIRRFTWEDRDGAAGYELRYGTSGSAFTAMTRLHGGLLTASPYETEDLPPEGTFDVGVVAFSNRFGRTTPAYLRDVEFPAFGQVLAFDYRGMWNATDDFFVNDLVTHRHVVWLALADSTGVEPGTDDDVWVLFTDSSVFEIIFTRTEMRTVPATPTSVDEDDNVPDGWTDDPVGPDGTKPFEWLSMRFREGLTWGAWSAPALWAETGQDGATQEWIYQRTANNTAPGTPTSVNTDDHVPTGWTDDPAGPTSVLPFEWVATRRKPLGRNASWGNWSVPKLWTELGRDGASQEWIYRRTTMQVTPDTPTSVNTDDHIPLNWTDDPAGPTVSLPFEWVTTRRRGQGHNPPWGNWSVPKLWSVYGGFSFEGTWNNGTTYNRNDVVRHKLKLWVSLVDNNTVEPGTDSSRWAMVTEDGKGGPEFIFRRTTTNTKPAAPNTTATEDATPDHVPTGWSDDPAGVDSTNKFEWASLRLSSGPGSYAKFGTPALWARYGEDGAGQEFVFRRTTGTKPDAPTTSEAEDGRNDVVPDGWTDNPTGPDEANSHEWVSERKFNRGGTTWGKFGTPALWARFSIALGFRYRGRWSSTVTYTDRDLVFWRNAVWKSEVNDNLNNTPGTDSTKWVLFADGANFEIIFQRTATSTAPSTPTSVNADDAVPAGWSDDPVGPNATNPFEWVSLRYRLGETWGNWSAPKLWSTLGRDGAVQEWIYRRTATNTAPSAPASENVDDAIPVGWSDDPTGPNATNPFEWVSTRRRATGHNARWGSWSTPRLWTELGSDGSSQEWIYRRTATDTALTAPASVNTDDHVPTSWTDDPTGVDADTPFEWVATRRRAAGIAQTWGNWSVPKLWAVYGQGNDGAGIEFIFQRTATNARPDKPDSSADQMAMNNYVPTGWSDDPAGPDSTNKFEWVAKRTRTQGGTAWSDFSTPQLWTRFAEDGASQEWIYRRTTANTAPGTPTSVNTDDHVPTGWSDDPAGPDGTNRFEWVSTRRRASGASTWGNWSAPKLWSVFAEDGVAEEFIYRRTTTDTKPSAPATSTAQKNARDHVPTGWTDDPTGVDASNRWEWVAVRKKGTTTLYGDFGTPALWATFSLGTEWHNIASGPPSNSLGGVGDFAIVTGTGTTQGNVYEKTGVATWTFRINLNGLDGTNAWLTGDTVPTGSIGTDGQFFFLEGSGETAGSVYQKQSGTWVKIIDIDQGGAGSVWHSGSGRPAADLGEVGDFYFRTDNGYVYRRETGDQLADYGEPSGPTDPPPQPPQPPSGAPTLSVGTITAPTTSGGTGTVVLSWTNVGSGSYELQYSAQSDFSSGVNVSSASTRSRTISRVSGTWYARVRLGTGTWSATVTITIPAFSGDPPPVGTFDETTAPANAPTVSTIGSTSISGTITAVTGATGYTVYASTNEIYSTNDPHVDVTGTSWEITGLTAETAYNVVYEATDGTDTTPVSPAETVTTMAAAVVIPTPIGMDVLSTGVLRVNTTTDNWFAEFQYDDNAGFSSPSSLYDNTEGVGHTATIPLADRTGTVYARARFTTAANGGGDQGPWSAADSYAFTADPPPVTALADPDTAPPVTGRTADTLSGTFSALAGADGYRVYASTNNVISDSDSFVDVTSGTAWSISGLSADTTYYVAYVGWQGTTYAARTDRSDDSPQTTTSTTAADPPPDTGFDITWSDPSAQVLSNQVNYFEDSPNIGAAFSRHNEAWRVWAVSLTNEDHASSNEASVFLENADGTSFSATEGPLATILPDLMLTVTRGSNSVTLTGVPIGDRTNLTFTDAGSTIDTIVDSIIAGGEDGATFRLQYTPSA